MTYSEKLRDPRWQKIRLKVFERDEWKCQRRDCKSPENTMLVVHHREYRLKADPWEYPLDCLITYCKNCHDTEHKLMQRTELDEGAFYKWKDLTRLLGFKPQGYLTQEGKRTKCGCFRLDYNPDAPEIVLPGNQKKIAEKAEIFALQNESVPIFIKAPGKDWKYCGFYRVEASTRNPIEIQIHRDRAKDRTDDISMILFLEKD